MSARAALSQKQKTGLSLLSRESAARYLLFYGGSQSGKTYLILRYIIATALLYPGSQQLILRKTERDCKNSVWLDLRDLLTPLIETKKVKQIGQPAEFHFANGSRIAAGGVAAHEIDKHLGYRYATVYINEASQIGYGQWEPFLSRLNDSSTREETGEPVICRLLVDENPPLKSHWTYKVWLQKTLPDATPINNTEKYSCLHFKPDDNPHNSAEYMETFEGRSDAYRKRFLFGEFGDAEGLLFSHFSHDLIVDDMEIPADWPKYRAFDFGSGGQNDPTACLWAAVSPDGVIHIYRELKIRGEMTSVEQAQYITQLSMADAPESQFTGRDLGVHVSRAYRWGVSDHQKDYRLNFESQGIQTRPANKSIGLTIDRVNEKMKNGQLKFLRSCTELIDEILSYQQDPKATDIRPLPGEDHLIDALRYLVMELAPAHNSNIIHGIRMG